MSITVKQTGTRGDDCQRFFLEKLQFLMFLTKKWPNSPRSTQTIRSYGANMLKIATKSLRCS